MNSSSNVNIIGLGYIGSVMAVGLGSKGINIFGTEKNPRILSDLSEGQFHIQEPALQVLWKEAKKNRNIRFVQKANLHADAQIWLVCVGTPVGSAGYDLTDLEDVLKDLALDFSRKTPKKPIVVIRSTIPPQSLRNRLIPLFEKHSGLKNGLGFDLVYYPEFLREGSALEDFETPPLNILGVVEPFDQLEPLQKVFGQKRPLSVLDAETVEFVKCISNAFHSMKISFANEVGALCSQLGVDSQRVMDVFCQDTRLNISKTYLKPGFIFGGPCLIKDLHGLMGLKNITKLNLPLLSAVLPSNDEHLQRCQRVLLKYSNLKRIGLFGLTFKPNSDDVRESPVLRMLLEEPFLTRVRELYVVEDLLTFKKTEDVIRAKLIQEEHVLENVDLVILGPKAPTNIEALMRFSGPILDLMYHPEVSARLSAHPQYTQPF